MAPTHLDDTALAYLRAGFAGDVIVAGSPMYDEARTVFNTMIDRRPAVIAQCEDAEDVAKAIGFARELELEIAVRGGGHNVTGTALVDDGIVIDLRRMNAVTVDPAARTARVGGGAQMSHLDRATEPLGLVTTGGRVSTTGVGGFALGGGSGWLERKFGLACDNLVSVELVTADGERVRAADDENPELFWALHGGGGNFGVATAMTFRLHALPALTVGLLMWPPEAGPEVIRAYREFMVSAPDEVGGACMYMTAPPERFVPEPLVGGLTAAMLLTYTGDKAEAVEVLAPMLELGHLGGMVGEMPYAELQTMIDDPPIYRNYWSATYLDTAPDEALDRFCARATDMIVPSPSLQVLFPLGGAVGKGPAEYPVPWRHAPWVVHPFGLWEDPDDDERGRRWARGTTADLRPWSIDAVYLNFVADAGEDRVVASLGPDNYGRLAATKARYDPDNIFHLNHNVKPG